MQNFGAVPVLYASQWFLTIFSCPFPATFSCRVIDVMLTEHSPNIMLRAALAVLAECEDDLLQLHDFEDLITYLKVLTRPASCTSWLYLPSLCGILCMCLGLGAAKQSICQLLEPAPASQMVIYVSSGDGLPIVRYIFHHIAHNSKPFHQATLNL